ncbi:hypothetical protein H920_04048 [Fukomys damarensis]|uniref:Uncharacterized protein n=1 Tax=Fukomys damarensis TaxID=885580 RepID=A0A091EGH6_FUKDA|nr:hypothetical protein H920_04048 [Fukomys damarensis]
MDDRERFRAHSFHRSSSSPSSIHSYHSQCVFCVESTRRSAQRLTAADPLMMRGETPTPRPAEESGITFERSP